VNQYGNHAEGDFIYSYCALLFKILPYTERVEVRIATVLYPIDP
jgi:hypothetical protein